jgi:hypothetical protein
MRDACRSRVQRWNHALAEVRIDSPSEEVVDERTAHLSDMGTDLATARQRFNSSPYTHCGSMCR